MSEYLDVWSNPENRATGKMDFDSAYEALAAAAAAGAGIGGLDADELAVLFDVSHWNSQPDSFFAEAVEKLGLAGLIVKVSDGKQVRSGNSQDISNYVDDKCHRFIQLAYDLKIPCMVYHYYQPGVDQSPSKESDWQYRALNAAVGNLVVNKSYYGVVIDIEEKTDTVPNTSGEVKQFWNWLTDDAKFGKVKRPVYTSMGYLNWCTDLSTWLSYPGADKDLWMAQWVFSTGTAATLDNLRSKLAGVNMKVMTPGYATWKLLQLGVFNLGGGALDVNVFKGSKQAFYDWIGFKVDGTVTEPEEPEEPGEYATVEALAAALDRIKVLEEWREKIKAA